METLEITIKKPYAKQVIDDLVAMDAIEIKLGKTIDPLSLVGSWPLQPKEEVERIIKEMRNEW